jgi:hypothetical protein
MTDDRTLVQIRERSFLDLLDLSLLLVRQRPWAVLVSAFVGIVPFAALNAWLLSDPAFHPALVLPLLHLEAPWATIPLTLTLGGLMFDQAPGTGAMLSRMVRALPALLLIHVVLRCVLSVTILLMPLVPGYFGFANQVILLEKAGAMKAVRRCTLLSRQRSGEFFLQWLGQIFFGSVFALCFWAGTSTAFSALTTRRLTWEPQSLSVFTGVRFQVGPWIAVAFFGVARFLIYIDQRIRLEGWELRLRLRSLGRELAGEKG